MFGVSGTELFIVVVFALLIFGPDKLPQFGRTAGRMFRDFKRAQDQMEAMIRGDMFEEKSSKPTAAVDPAVAAREIPDDEDEEEEEED